MFVTVVAPLVPSAFSLLLGAAGILFGAARVLLLRQAARGRPSRWAAAFLIVVAVAMPAVTAAASTPPR